LFAKIGLSKDLGQDADCRCFNLYLDRALREWQSCGGMGMSPLMNSTLSFVNHQVVFVQDAIWSLAIEQTLS